MSSRQCLDPSLNDCSLEYIRIENRTSTSAVVEWKGDQCDVRSSVEVHHLQWLACSKQMDSNIPMQHFLSTRNDFVRLSGLVPNSLYQVEFGGREARFRTEPDVPDIRPTFLSLRPGKQSIHLKWKRSVDNDCRLQNGLLSGYRVELWGLSPWVLDRSGPLKSVSVGENIYEYYFHQLKSFTTYGLRVYLYNKGVEEVNPGVFLKTKSTTLPTKPNPPTTVRLKPLNRTLFLAWDPEYPPTGIVEFYHILLRETESNVIKRGYYVHKVDNRPRCPGEENSVCWVVSYDDIQLGVKYTIVIRTKNEDVEELSSDSKGVEFIIPETRPDTHISESHPNSREQEGEDYYKDYEFYHSFILIILIVLGSAITILLIIVIALVFKIKGDKLKSSMYENHNLSTYFRQGSVSTHMTTTGYARIHDSLDYSQVLDDEPEEHYLNVSQRPKPGVDVNGYLTPSFSRKANHDDSGPKSSTFFSPNQQTNEKIQIKSYDRVRPSVLDNSECCNYIDLDNVIHQKELILAPNIFLELYATDADISFKATSSPAVVSTSNKTFPNFELRLNHRLDLNLQLYLD
ncbi:unnamed protein product [Lepeophtheirus salmonis]|uniref:(salmon louse) hypothetical protein n=1 Tax=Lepeophtheirus salmonis TaxID=72036 RepID=A0A7R8CFT0_LEPSM|nr:unnamed protein product [Lepeophtheirus salmonis]CAF2753383.1 unnamed protein product [Lepeophtheirus salmonis]